jgi:hypothetical protein
LTDARATLARDESKSSDWIADEEKRKACQTLPAAQLVL